MSAHHASSGGYNHHQIASQVDLANADEPKTCYAADFMPSNESYYGCVNCGDESVDQKRPSLFQLRRLRNDSTQSSVTVGTSFIPSDVKFPTKHGLRSTCLSFKPNSSSLKSLNDTLKVQCVTGLNNGTLCVHDLSIPMSDDENEISVASMSLYPTKSSRPATVVAWRPKIESHAVIGLSTNRKLGRGDREFCCLLWDVEAQRPSRISSKISSTNIYNGQTPLHRFSNNTSVSSLSWSNKEGNTLLVGTYQKIHIYDIRLAGTNTPPSSKSVHNNFVRGIEMHPFHEHIFSTFTNGLDDVKVWDIRRKDSALHGIKPSKAVSTIKWSTNTGCLAVVSSDTVRSYDTLSNRPILTNILHSSSDISCIAFQPRRKEEKFSHSNSLKHPRRMLTVSSNGDVRTIPEILNAPMSISLRDGTLASSFGNSFWINRSKERNTANDDSRYIVNADNSKTILASTSSLIGEDISETMMRRAKYLHINSHPTRPARCLEILSDEIDNVTFKDEGVNALQLWRLWSWIERVEQFIDEYFNNKSDTNRNTLWSASSLVTSGALKLFKEAEEVSGERISALLDCVQYESKARAKVLSACGWIASENITCSSTANVILPKFERKAALHVFKGDLEVSVQCLQKGANALIESSDIETNRYYAEVIHLVAMCIAGFNAKSTVWRDACKSLLKRIDVIDKSKSLNVCYLRAACIFLCNIGQDAFTSSVLLDYSLRLTDRVAFGCLFLPDNELFSFLETSTKRCIDEGNLEGVALTGLGGRLSIRLLQSYLDRTGDIQTIALICTRVMPEDWVYDKETCSEWLQSYRDLLNDFQMWHSRSRFDVGRATYLRTLQKRSNQEDPVSSQQSRSRTSKESASNYIPPQLYARCNYCNLPLNLETHRRGDGAGNSWLSRQKPVLNCCPHCRKPLPRCAICLLPLSCPNPYLELKRERSESITNRESDNSGLSSLIPPAEWWAWCIRCKHGGHSHHLRGWFSKHKVCPVSGCDCMCESDVVSSSYICTEAR